jgi:hypothetical protein
MDVFGMKLNRLATLVRLPPHVDGKAPEKNRYAIVGPIRKIHFVRKSQITG